MTPQRWARIKEVYGPAFEMLDVERSAFLDSACDGDADLRAEVQRLLTENDGSLDSPARDLLKEPTELAPGDTVAHYCIQSKLGEGGMGVVYKAADSRLGRSVALKFVRMQFGRRAQREARAVAALNHPNICTLHDVGPNYLVMELVDGPTLAERIAAGRVPIREVLDIARQIADALEAAHEKGIIHRDLKPANIKLTAEGKVKVLDFGLAKEQAHRDNDARTMTISETCAGTILGTAAYMSPEQASGKPVDRRADIWSFGVVLWEMLTGLRLFEGETLTQTLADVLRAPIRFEELPGETPEPVRQLLRRCLDRDVRRRLRDIGEARIVLEDTVSGTAVPRQRAAYSAWLFWTVAGVLTMALAVILFYPAARPPPLRALIRLNAELAPDAPITRAGTGGGGNMIALSPDGARLALTMRGADGKVRLQTRLMNQSEFTPLAGTDDASFPFFSPDGKWIGFSAEGKLRKVGVEGGAVSTLCDAPHLRGASWGDDGNIIAALDTKGVLYRIPSTGGTPVEVTRLLSGETIHRWPQVLPGSEAVLFTVNTQTGRYDNAEVGVISLRTGARKTVARGGFSGRYLSPPTGTGPGYVVYLHGSTLFGVPFDVRRLIATGPPSRILEDVSGTATAGGDFASAVNGTFVYLARKDRWSISWLDPSGRTQPLYEPAGVYANPRFSPDGGRFAFSVRSGEGDDIWVKNLALDTTVRLTFLPGRNVLPVWTPDGKNIVFESTSPAAPGLYWMRSDGSGEANRLTDGKLGEVPYSFSPDGKRLAFSRVGNRGTHDIFTAALVADPGRGDLGVRLGEAELFLGTPSGEFYPAFSPDGHWIAYNSNESGKLEVYVRPFPRSGGRWLISAGAFPVWSRDGHDLLFETTDGRVMAVSYTARGDSFVPGNPRQWSDAHIFNGDSSLPNFDLAPDGKRLVAFFPDSGSGGNGPTHLTFLLNFFDDMRRRVPAGK